MNFEKSNEQIVTEIRENINVATNYELLFNQNQTLIRKILRPFADSSGEDIEDLLQESFFALQMACEHYESSENVRFMSYASYWIKQGARNYINKCGLLKLPSYESVKVRKYRRFCADYERDNGYVPGDGEVKNVLHYTVEDIDLIKRVAQGMSSLDTPIADTDSLTLGDTVTADCDLENDTIEQIFDEQKKNELWGIVAEHVSQQENEVIRAYYLQGLSMPDIARRYGLTYQRIAQIKHDALGRLRRGKAKKELQQRFEVLDSSLFSGGFKSYCRRDFTSSTEYIAIKRAEIQKGYDSTVDYLNKKYLQDSKERLRVLQEEYDKEIKKLEIRG